MIALRTIDIRNDFKRVSDLINSGEKVLIARPRNENLVVLSEKEYNKLDKAKLLMEDLDDEEDEKTVWRVNLDIRINHVFGCLLSGGKGD